MTTPPAPPQRQGSGMQITLVGVLVLVLLGLLWFMLLRNGSGEGEEAAPSTVPTQDVLEELPEIEADEIPDGGGRRGAPVETFEVFAPRDPFVPLIAGRDSAAGESAGGGAAGTGGTGGGGTGGAGGGTGGRTGGRAPSTATGGDVGGHTVKFVDSFRRNGRELVQVQVDGTVYTVAEKDTFAQSFQVLSIDGRCASFLHGDDEFTLCEGEEILK